MSTKLKLRFRAADSDHGIPHEYEFPDEEWDALREFVTESDRLMATQFVQAGMRVHAELTCVDGVNTEIHVEHPNDDILATVLHRLRPFLLLNERTHFNKVCNILARRITEPLFREQMKALKLEFSGIASESQMQIRVENGPKSAVYNRLETVMNWLNAFEYHRDREMQNDFRDLKPLQSDVFERFLIWDAIVNIVNSVLKLKTLIEWLNTPSSRELHLKL